MSEINKISIVTAQGAETYQVGWKVGTKTIAYIKENTRYITGDPYSCFTAHDEKGDQLVMIDGNCPVVIEY